MKTGEQVRLVKKTFMQAGVFILTNSIVEIAEVHEGIYDVIYYDKEGHSHLVKNLRESDLQPI
ncbi:MAG: hypothetical protein H7A25_07415 [Leptospiraceae bacterium]|nr:hypothetical protein [Leptospiraceae bacterium]MCP5499713.1 hypothetical protein [Leptospiraceae bacterium]